jgi:hypothetical protein
MTHSSSDSIGTIQNFPTLQESYAFFMYFFLFISGFITTICIRRSFDEVCFTFKRCSFLFERERERELFLLACLSRFSIVLSFVLLFLLSVPGSFAQMLASPVYFSGRVYPLTLDSQGSPLAGLYITNKSKTFIPSFIWGNSF